MQLTHGVEGSRSRGMVQCFWRNMYFGELKATKNTEHCNSATTEADWYGHIMKERLLLSLTDGKVQYGKAPPDPHKSVQLHNPMQRTQQIYGQAAQVRIKI